MLLTEDEARELLTSSASKIFRMCSKKLNDFTSNINFSLKINLKVVSVALIVEKPVRREFLTVWFDDINVTMSSNLIAKSTEVTVLDFQVDTFSETAAHPVMIRAVRDPSVVPSHTPVFQSTIVEEFHPEQTTRCFKYAAFRLLELSVVVDSASLKLLAVDLGVDFTMVSGEEILAQMNSHLWVSRFNRSAVRAASRELLASVRKTRLEAEKPKLYIETLEVHPIKINLSFNQSTFPRKIEHIPSNLLSVGLLPYIPIFTSTEKMTLRFDSFVARHFMDTYSVLLQRLKALRLRDLQNQLAPLIGSLTLTGSAFALVKKVASGVTSSFYEVSGVFFYLAFNCSLT